MPGIPHTAAPARRYLTIEQSAEILGVTTRSIRRWIADGILPGYRIGGKVVRIKASDLDAALRRIPSAGDAA